MRYLQFLLATAVKSLRNRFFTTSLTVLSIALSVALLIGIERIRSGARDSFSNTISQTDLIVGARGGTIQLLLYSVFRIGSATNNIGVDSWEHFRNHPSTAWTIPYSLGDSHRGYRVVGTNNDFYEHYRFHGDRRMEVAKGELPKERFDVILGSEVAEAIGYRVGDRIVVSHGISDVSIVAHDNMPFTVRGILARTATPIDRSLYISLEAMEAIHMDWTDGAPPVRGTETKPETIRVEDIKPQQITAFLLRTKSRIDTLHLQREINTFADEPLLAIIPGVALSELWNGLSYAEDALRIVSLFVIVVGLLGMLVSLYNSLNERRREMAIFRAVGAGPGTILVLLVVESFVLTLAGIVLGVTMTYGSLITMQPIIEGWFGMHIPISMLSGMEWLWLALVLGSGILLGAVPAARAYRNTLIDGLTIRV